MNFCEYRIAAEKHIKTCDAIIDSYEKLKIYDSSAIILNRNKQDTLHNLYYLSGYILESISTYAIYKHFRWHQNKSVKILDNTFSNNCNFSFYPDHGFQYYVHGHRFQYNQFEVLRIPFVNSSVPFLNQTVPVSIEVQVLFNIWSPEIRYHESNKAYPSILNSQIQLDEFNVKNFVDVSKQVYNNLMLIVG